MSTFFRRNEFLCLTTLTLLSSLMIGGCGASKAIDSVNSMPASLANTNQQLSQTNDQIAQTNNHIGNVDHRTSLQTDESAYHDCFDVATARTSVPPETLKLAGCEAQAKENTPDDLIKLFYLQINWVDSAVYDPSMRDGQGKPITADDLDLWKQSTVDGLGYTAMLIPQDVVESLVKKEITDSGLYDMTMYNILMLRAEYTAAYLLSETHFSMSNGGVGIDNVAKATESIEYADHIQYILDLPYLNKIRFVTYNMADNHDDSITDKNIVDAHDIWTKIVSALTGNQNAGTAGVLRASELSKPEVAGLLEEAKANLADADRIYASLAATPSVVGSKQP